MQAFFLYHCILGNLPVTDFLHMGCFTQKKLYIQSERVYDLDYARKDVL